MADDSVMARHYGHPDHVPSEHRAICTYCGPRLDELHIHDAAGHRRLRGEISELNPSGPQCPNADNVPSGASTMARHYGHPDNAPSDEPVCSEMTSVGDALIFHPPGRSPLGDNVPSDREDRLMVSELPKVELYLAENARVRAENARLRETIARVERALDDELANLADDGARLSHSVVRRIEAALRGPESTVPCAQCGGVESHRPGCPTPGGKATASTEDGT